MTDDPKLYLYEQCRRFAAADCPDDLAPAIDDVAHDAFEQALKELPHLRPQPGKTLANCIEGLACLRVIDAYKHLKTKKERRARDARRVSPTDALPDGNGQLQFEIVLPEAMDAMDNLMSMVDAHFLPDWVRELRRVQRSLYGRDRALANALLKEAERVSGDGPRRKLNVQRICRQLGMSVYEFGRCRARLRHRFRKAWNLFKDYYATR